jgi:hypothetical protein
MGTFAALEARIIAELHRDDVAAVVDDYINDAIAHYQRYRFWFNETSATQNTANGTATYAWPSDFVELDSMTITANGTIIKMEQLSPREIDERYFNSTLTGVPYHFAMYKQQYRLYPTPNATYVLTQYYLKNYTALTTGSASSNVWTTEAEELIRTRAKKLLYGHFIPAADQLPGLLTMLDQHEQDVLKGLQRQTWASTATGRMRAW